jgi:hypothetical protein
MTASRACTRPAEGADSGQIESMLPAEIVDRFVVIVVTLSGTRIWSG